MLQKSVSFSDFRFSAIIDSVRIGVGIEAIPSTDLYSRELTEENGTKNMPPVHNRCQWRNVSRYRGPGISHTELSYLKGHSAPVSEILNRMRA